MGEAATAAGDSATQVDALASNQTSAKWGTEDGPSNFRTAYSTKLWDLTTDLQTLSDQLAAFVASVESAAKELDSNDSDAAQAQVVLHAEATANQSAPASPAPGPRPGNLPVAE